MRKFLTVLVFVFGFFGPAFAGGHLENEKRPKNFCNIILMPSTHKTRKSWIQFSQRPSKEFETAKRSATHRGESI